MRNTATVLSFFLTLSVASAQATWTQLAPTASPTPRTGASAASDVTGMLLFGGNSGAGRLDEIWRLDPIAVGGPAWTNMSPAGALPAARQGAAAAYDLARGVLVIFGGRSASGNAGIQGDTWEWDSGTNTWTDKTPAVPNFGVNTPPQLENPMMVYDTSNGSCILYGGRGNATTAPMEYGGTWSWDGSAWTLLTPTTSPPARRNHAMAHNAATGETMVYGGIASGTALGDTWLWDGSDWSNVATATTPFANGTHNGSLLNGLAFDSVRDRFVLTSGTYPGGSSLNPDDTYEFDGADWVNRGSSGMGNRYDGSLVYVEVAGKTYRFGGFNNVNGHSNLLWDYQTTSIAAANSYGAGCAGQSGAGLTLTGSALPWAGQTWNGTCTTMGPASLALAVWGLATSSLPLDVALPGFGQPGCVLLNTADSIVGPAIPAAGSVTVSLPIPAGAGLGGFQVHGQVAELDFGVTSLWTSNGVTLTIGEL